MRPERQLHHERRHPLSGGFTLLELGVVIAVISVLTAGVAVGGSAYLRAASAQRSAAEMANILKVGQAALFRQLTPNYNDNPITYSLQGTKLQRNINVNAPFSGGADSPCYVVGQVGQDPFDIKSALSATQPGTLLGPYQQPYRVCVNARRVEVQTCIPQLDAEDYSEFRAMGAVCNTFLCPATFSCRTLGTSLIPTQSQKLTTTYATEMYKQPLK